MADTIPTNQQIPPGNLVVPEPFTPGQRPYRKSSWNPFAMPSKAEIWDYYNRDALGFGEQGSQGMNLKTNLPAAINRADEALARQAPLTHSIVSLPGRAVGAVDDYTRENMPGTHRAIHSLDIPSGELIDPSRPELGEKPGIETIPWLATGALAHGMTRGTGKLGNAALDRLAKTQAVPRLGGLGGELWGDEVGGVGKQKPKVTVNENQPAPGAAPKPPEATPAATPEAAPAAPAPEAAPSTPPVPEAVPAQPAAAAAPPAMPGNIKTVFDHLQKKKANLKNVQGNKRAKAGHATALEQEINDVTSNLNDMISKSADPAGLVAQFPELAEYYTPVQDIGNLFPTPVSSGGTSLPGSPPAPPAPQAAANPTAAETGPAPNAQGAAPAAGAGTTPPASDTAKASRKTRTRTKKEKPAQQAAAQQQPAAANPQQQAAQAQPQAQAQQPSQPAAAQQPAASQQTAQAPAAENLQVQEPHAGDGKSFFQRHKKKIYWGAGIGAASSVIQNAMRQPPVINIQYPQQQNQDPSQNPMYQYQPPAQQYIPQQPVDNNVRIPPVPAYNDPYMQPQQIQVPVPMQMQQPSVDQIRMQRARMRAQQGYSY